MKSKFRLVKAAALLLTVLMIVSSVGMLTAGAATEESNPADIVENIEDTTPSEPEETQPTTTESDSTEPTPTESESTEPTTAPVTPITPSPVGAFVAQSVDTGSVVLKWSGSNNATEYVIYRAQEKSDGSMSGYEKYATTTATELKVTGLEQAWRYKFKVYAYRIADGYTTHSAEKALAVMTKPETAAEIKLSEKTTSSMKFSWSKNSKASRYIIYRAKEKADGTFGNYKKLKEISGSKTSFVDKKLSSGTIYKYAVKVLRKTGGLSAVSSAKATKGMTKLDTPKKLVNKKFNPTSVKLAWSKVKRAEKYEVYRGKKLIKTTKKTTYSDKKLKSGTEYKYSVKAVRIYNHKKHKSAPVKFKTATTVKVNTVSGGLSGTWVEVSISTQTMRMYVNSKLYVSTPVVTGNYGALSTNRGHHRVISKKSPARLRGSYNGSSWDTPVHYWLGFTSNGQGLHDSTWRSAYGGTIYKGNGSHGCVNTPLSAMGKIYSKSYMGMPIIVY